MNRGRGGNRGGGGGGGRYYGNRGRSPRPVGRYVVRQRPVVGSHTDDASLTRESGSSGNGRNSEVTSVDGVTKKINDMSTSDYSYGANSKPSRSFGNSEMVQRVPEAEEERAKPLDPPSVAHQGSNNDFPSLSMQPELRTDHMIRLQYEEEDNRTPSCFSVPSSDATYKKKEPSQAMGSHFQDGQFPQEVQNEKNASDRTSEFEKINDMSTSDYSYGANSQSSRSFGNSELVQRVPKAEEERAKPLDLPSVVRQGYNNDLPSSSTQSELNATTTHMIQLQYEEEDNRTLSCFSVTSSDATSKKKEPSQGMGSHFQDGQFPQEVQNEKNASDRTSEFENSELHKGLCFDICEERNRNVVKLKPSLFNKNRAMRNEAKRHTQGMNIEILRTGMILLKGYLPLADQVKLIKTCRDLGLGPGGFYQPSYRDGATLHLKMMCLGKSWDPETSKYDDIRPVDGAKPPPIPDDFVRIVSGAIRECHDHLASQSKGRDPRNIIPSVSPNICIVNFYSKTGKLGLHQDKDESQESLHKGLPVVSLSLGDKAEFLFGDQRDIEKAEKVELESGDVLIFGGDSRHIFHGVRAIHPDTAPKPLLDETNLKPGRLNLTFREY